MRATADRLKRSRAKKRKARKPWRNRHAESEILFDYDPEHGLVVVKRYRVDAECIAWLNGHLSDLYPPERGLPVAQHEFAALSKLAPHGVAPEPVRLLPDGIVMRYAGEPIDSPNAAFTKDSKRQFRAILDTLEALEFRHNDMLPRNILVHDGKLALIDFTLSEFDGVSIMRDLPNPGWARPGRDSDLLRYGDEFCPGAVTRWRRWLLAAPQRVPSPSTWVKTLPARILPPRQRLRRLARDTYNYHNLGSGVFPQGEEKTPFGSGERYNFDRMYMMVSNYDFTGKSVVDLGCNSGWFAIQLKLLGAGAVIGIDHAEKGIMGGALEYARCFERAYKVGARFVDQHLEKGNLVDTLRKAGSEQVDCALLLSVLHHIGEHDLMVKSRFFTQLYDRVRDVIFYEDHEFWNDMTDADGRKLETIGAGYRYGWNEDMSWQRKIGALDDYGPKILDSYRATWRRDVLLLDRFSEIRFLGFSEKRRPMFAFFK